MASLTTVGVFLLLLLLLYRYFLYPVFFSPLSNIPNAHFSAPILPLWIRSKRQTGTAVRTLQALHEKHGPVVRLAPNEISVNSADALRTVYTGGFDKHRWYLDAFVNYGKAPMVAMLESQPHSTQKRMVSNIYSKSYLQGSKDLQTVSDRLICDRFLPIMHGVEEHGGELEVLDYMQGVGMDFTTAYLFGVSNSTNFMRNAEYRHHWLEEYKTFKHQLPQDRANGEIERFNLAMCEAAERFIHSEQAKEQHPSDTRPVVYERLATALGASALSDDPSLKFTVATEMLDHIVAGHETTGITLTYLMYELSQRPYLQDRLHSELLTLEPPIIYPGSNNTATAGNIDSRLPSPRSIDALPLLDNILRETLRRYAPAAAQQPRITPHGATIEGFADIPAGVLVSANAHCLHRNEAVFPDPETWMPERWDCGDGDKEGKKREEMNRWFWAFGSGGRMCLGSHFVLQEMKLVVASVYSNYRTEIAEVGDMRQSDEYIAVPRGERCVLKFVRNRG